MSTRGWQRVAAVPLLALAAANVVGAAEEELPKPAESPRRIAVPIPAAEPEAPVPWSARVPQSLRALGVESWWDVFQFGLWSGSLGFTFDDHEQRTKVPGSPDDRFASQLLTETISIGNDGFAVIDPRLLTGTFVVGFSLEQEWQDSTGKSTYQHGDLTNYAFGLTALRDSPYPVDFFANQNQNTYVLASGTTTHTDLMNRGITFRLREDSMLRDKGILPYFTASLRAAQEFNKTTTTTAGQSFVQDDRRDLLTLDFQNGSETSDLTFQYQFTNLDNFAYQPGSYHSHTVNGVYSIDFGPTLNWRSDSRVNYYVRNGRDPLSDSSTLEANEFLTIDHNVDLSSNYNYQLSWQDAQGGTAITHSVGAQVNEQFYRNFSGTAGVTGLYSSLPGGTISSAGVAGNLSYNHRLAWEGNLYVNGGGGYLLTDTHVAAGLVQVTDAAYQVPDAVGAGSVILLKDRNIVTTSIEVIVVKAGGARVPAIVDADYTVRVDGDRTSILPSATSAVMQPGDPLNVSYTYQVSPDSRFQTISNSLSFSADWAWFGFSASHDQSDQTPLSGTDATLLVNDRRDAAHVYLRGVWEQFQTKVGAGYTRYDSSRLAYREARLDQYLSYLPTSNLQLNLSGDEYRTEYDIPVHTTTGASVRFDVQWNHGAWVTSGYAGWRTYRDTLQPTESILEAGVRTRRTWTKLDLNLAAGMQDRKRGNVDSLNAIVHVGIVRRF